MSDTEEQLRLRVAQLEHQARIKGWEEINRPDPSLAPDEWWAVFSDYKNPVIGSITKIQPMALVGDNSCFKVKRIL